MNVKEKIKDLEDEIKYLKIDINNLKDNLQSICKHEKLKLDGYGHDVKYYRCEACGLILNSRNDDLSNKLVNTGKSVYKKIK